MSMVSKIIKLEGTQSLILDKISSTSKEPLRIDEMNLRSVSERRDESKGIFNLDQMSE